MPEGFEQNLIALVRAGISGEKAQIDIGALDFEKLSRFAAAHHICYLVYSALINCGADKAMPQMQKLFLAAGRELLRSERQLGALDAVTEALSQSGIEYMLLKGCVLKELYPESAMRVMGDIDILINEKSAKDIRDIMARLGYEFFCESDHEYIYKSEGVVIEFHKRLIPSYNEDYYEYFGDGLARAQKKNGSEYGLCSEDTFIYLFLHFAKHYRDGGIGIKHVCDLYLYLKNQDPDRARIERALSDIGLSEFYKNVCDLLGMWFESRQAGPKARHISQVVIMSGAFGRHKEKVYAAALRSSEASRGRFTSRLFPRLEVMKIKHKYLEKAPILLPFAWVLRIISAVFKKPKKIKEQFCEQVRITGDDLTDYKNALLYVGLSFEKREDNKK